MSVIKGFILMCLTAGSAWCCLAPANIEGVAFTSEEILNITKLESLGTQNVSFFKDSSATVNAIRYISHYNKDAMVFIGNYGLSYQESVKLNCMGVILDQSKFTDIYKTIDKNIFNFAEAVKIELIWMKQNGIISLTDDFIQTVVDSLGKSNNGGVQYWTKQRRVLGYNSWYTKDAQSGVWSTNDADGVNGVRGTNGCSVVSADFGLPAQELGTTSVKLTAVHNNNSFKISEISNTTLQIQFQNAIEKETELSLVNLSGKIFSVAAAKKGTANATVSLAGVQSSGLYYLVVNSAQSKVSLPVMIVR